MRFFNYTSHDFYFSHFKTSNPPFSTLPPSRSIRPFLRPYEQTGRRWSGRWSCRGSLVGIGQPAPFSRTAFSTSKPRYAMRRARIRSDALLGVRAMISAVKVNRALERTLEGLERILGFREGGKIIPSCSPNATRRSRTLSDAITSFCGVWGGGQSLERVRNDSRGFRTCMPILTLYAPRRLPLRIRANG